MNEEGVRATVQIHFLLVPLGSLKYLINKIIPIYVVLGGSLYREVPAGGERLRWTSALQDDDILIQLVEATAPFPLQSCTVILRNHCDS